MFSYLHLCIVTFCVSILMAFVSITYVISIPIVWQSDFLFSECKF
uniref:Uncharacterized protein n=1 Tax=Arundo donax TaxID=35708 RepID=A0A0A9HUE0_ARUDO